MRRFVIGDIHGCAKALRAVVDAIKPSSDDELVFLGDYIDRGPNSRDVVDQIIALQQSCQVIPLRGNHEIMLMAVAMRGLDSTTWLQSGGQATVNSYGGKLSKIPAGHFEFFQGLRRHYEIPDSIFVHAGYQHDRPMVDQEEVTVFWTHLSNPPPPPHQSGKRVFVGHTPQGSGTVLDLGHLVCVDTYCFGGGFLTAMNVESNEVIQADRHGFLRRSPMTALKERLRSCYVHWQALKSKWQRSPNRCETLEASRQEIDSTLNSPLPDRISS
ncbi:MAG: serine/threonine protein phosphatase [Pirellulales bacterium]|nr:serine/threonine protein phosphatase [Pirellulales bacterium]